MAYYVFTEEFGLMPDFLILPDFTQVYPFQITMVEKDVEAGVGDVGVCSENIVVCGAIAEGTMIFFLISPDLLI